MLKTSQFTIQSSYFTVYTSLFIFHTSYFIVHTSHFTGHTSQLFIVHARPHGAVALASDNILFEVGNPNLVCGILLGWRNGADHFGSL